MDKKQEKTRVNKVVRNEKGQVISGTPNPNGRPKGTFSVVEMIRRKLQETPEGKNKTYAELFVLRLMKKAIEEGDTATMRDIIDRVDGKAMQSIQLDANLDVRTQIDETTKKLSKLFG